MFLLTLNFAGGFSAPCRAACDVNGDGTTGGVTDAVALLGYSFLRGPAPVAPFPECGPGELATDSVLGCEQPNVCSVEG